MLPNNPFIHSVVHAIIGVLAFGVPILVLQFPQVANLTIGGVALLLVHWAENTGA